MTDIDDKKNSVLAPIILFVYNRLWHTQQTIEALKKNTLANQSDLIIYSDAAKNDLAIPNVQAVRDYLNSITGFKTVKTVERERNWGLAANIIDGVTDVINEYGKAIVMEDDIVTSPAYLSFMNQALDFYQNDTEVWHISGWNYPLDMLNIGDAFFWRAMNCWGWATWADRWKYFEKKPQKLIETWSKQQKHHFDLDGTGVFWHQVVANAEGGMNTWAIFWYATIYENDGLCLNPVRTYVDNIGFDGSGVHCGNTQAHMATGPVLSNKTEFNWPVELIESPRAVEIIKHYYKKLKKPLIERAINKLVRLTIGKKIIR